MNYIADLSKKTTISIAGRVNEFSAPQKMEIIEYGVYSILSNMLKSVILFVIAYLLGVFLYVLISYVSFGILRTFAYGVHAKTSFGCFVLALLIHLPVVYFSMYYPLETTLVYIIFISCCLLILRYAPADVIENPVLGTKHRHKLKMGAILTLIILFIITLSSEPVIASVITLSCFLECLTITPLFFSITNSRKGGEYLNEEN